MKNTAIFGPYPMIPGSVRGPWAANRGGRFSTNGALGLFRSVIRVGDDRVAVRNRWSRHLAALRISRIPDYFETEACINFNVNDR
jgi:hypothetical protein